MECCKSDIIESRFDDRYDDYRDLLRQYNEAPDVGTREALWPHLESAQNRAYDAENWRRGAIAAVVSVYAANVLDALLFHPRPSSAVTIKGLTMSPNQTQPVWGLAVAATF